MKDLETFDPADYLTTDAAIVAYLIEAIQTTHAAFMAEAVITAKRAQAKNAKCDVCGKSLGGPGHIHTCTPKDSNEHV